MPDRTSTPATAQMRTTAARAIQILCTLIAVMTIVAIITVAARGNINADNVLVELVKGVATTFDGPFSRENGIFAFSGDGAETRNAVVNWGMAAAAWFVIGRVGSAVVRP